MPDQPWWDNLAPDFHQWPEGFDLDRKTGMLVGATASVDIALRTVLASIVSTLAMPSSFLPSRLKRDREERDFYQEKADRHDPGLFFRPPPEDVPVTSSAPGWPHFRPRNGHCESLSFQSPFEPVNPRMRKSFTRLRRNNKAVAQYWRHEDGPRPTICVIHGFIMDPYWVNSMFLSLPWFYNQGYDILLYTLPFHGRRQEVFSPFSGFGYFSSGVSHVNETVAQAVFDFRVFLNYLKNRRGAEKVGVTGISLGGYTASLLACVEDRLEFSIPNVPVVSLIDVMFQWYPASLLLKTVLKVANIPASEVRHLMAVHCPLTYKPVLPRDRLMIIGGAGDRLSPPKQVRILWEHWEGCPIHWFPGNHVIHLGQGRYLKEMVGFFDSIGFKPA